MLDLITLISKAKEACDYVYDLCPLGSSNRKNGDLPNTSKIANQALSDAKKNFEHLVSEIESNSTLLEEEKPFEIIKLLADVGKKAMAANCQEMAAIAFLFLLEKEIKPIELVFIPRHTFLILGRNPQTSIHAPETWNEEVVICDPWRRKYKSGSSVLHEESMVYSPKKLVEKLQKKSIPFESLTIAFPIHPGATDVLALLKK